jgi:glutathione S-transferase
VTSDDVRLFHLALADEWAAVLTSGADYRRSTIDSSLEEEGFIHASFAHQVQGTADRYYRDRPDVVLLQIDRAALPVEVRVEHGFPHLYGPLPVAAVVRADPVPLEPDGRLRTAELVAADTTS